MKKVIVLLSSYNGEKYIKDQIISIEKQSYKNIDIFIRDDGSTDNTIKIIKELKRTYKNIKLETGKNIGCTKNFFQMLKTCGKYDYYAFCDQDDIWLKDKINFAVEKLNNEKPDIPLLYTSSYDFYDSNMNFISHNDKIDKKPSFPKALFECIAPGMTMVINNKAREEIIKKIPVIDTLHDGWIYLVVSALGKVIYDKRPTVKYRRHQSTVTDVPNNFLKKIVWKIKTFLFSGFWEKLKKQILIFNSLYYDKLNKKDKKLLKLLCKKKNIITQIKKVFYPTRFKDSITKELILRFMFLIGKI